MVSEKKGGHMSLLDKAKAAAGQAAAKAKETVEDVQAKRELSQAYGELGKTTFELIESGEISHPRLDPLAAKVRTAAEQAAARQAEDGEAEDGEAETHDPSAPPPPATPA
jgi:hypothetical protein